MREPVPKREQREIVVPARNAAPRRNPAAGAARRPAAGWFSTTLSAVRGIGRLCRNRPGEVLGSVVALGAVAAVAMNALGFQGGRHPAPIFPTLGGHAAERAPAARPGDIADAVPRKAEAKPAEMAAPEPKPLAAAETAASKPAAAKPVAAKPTARDAIADIIKAGETTASVTPRADTSVAQAQRALVKLGYGPLKADGVLGAGTRAAIEKFERDRKLPVKGLAAGRTLRELASRAGTPPG